MFSTDSGSGAFIDGRVYSENIPTPVSVDGGSTRREIDGCRELEADVGALGTKFCRQWILEYCCSRSHVEKNQEILLLNISIQRIPLCMHDAAWSACVNCVVMSGKK